MPDFSLLREGLQTTFAGSGTAGAFGASTVGGTTLGLTGLARAMHNPDAVSQFREGSALDNLREIIINGDATDVALFAAAAAAFGAVACASVVTVVNRLRMARRSVAD